MLVRRCVSLFRGIVTGADSRVSCVSVETKVKSGASVLVGSKSMSRVGAKVDLTTEMEILGGKT